MENRKEIWTRLGISFRRALEEIHTIISNQRDNQEALMQIRSKEVSIKLIKSYSRQISKIIGANSTSVTLTRLVQRLDILETIDETNPNELNQGLKKLHESLIEIDPIGDSNNFFTTMFEQL
jgi:hypothetical protein